MANCTDLPPTAKAWLHPYHGGRGSSPSPGRRHDHGAAEPACTDCPTCSGAAAPDAPATQTLGFAIDTARQAGGGLAFWQVLIAEHVYRLAGDSHPAVDAFLREMAEEQLDSTVVALPDDWVQASPSPEGGRDGEGPERGSDRWGEAAKGWTNDIAGDDPYESRSPETGDGSWSGLQCGVKSFLYPRCWARRLTDGYVGVCYAVEMEFENRLEDGYLCQCCVFRHFLRKTVTHSHSSPQRDPTYHIDRTEQGKSAGGAREDNTGPYAPDAPKKEHGRYSLAGCALTFDDNPHEVWRAWGTWIRFTYDYLGVIYDRCNNWAIRRAERMVFTGAATKSLEGEVAWLDVPEGYSHVHPPPSNAADSWSHENRSNEDWGVGAGLFGRERPPGAPMPMVGFNAGGGCC